MPQHRLLYLDLLTAARKQNDGRAESSSAIPADWACRVVKKRRAKPKGPGAR